MPADSHMSKHHVVIAKGDSGATNHYWRTKDAHVLENIKKDTSTKVTLPNAEGTHSTSKGTLPMSQQLSETAKQATVLPRLESSSLISLGQLCDDDCKVELDKKNLKVFKEERLIMKGHRNKSDGLWDMPITRPITTNNVILPAPHPGIYPTRMCMHKNNKTTKKFIPKIKLMCRQKLHQNIDQLIQEFTSKDNKANVIIKKKQTKVTLARYLHACCLSPPITTFSKAISNNNFITWPGLTVNLIQKHLPKSMHTYQGHMHTERKGLQSTKEKPTVKEEDLDSFPIPNEPNIKSNSVCYAIIDPSETITGCIDLTGRFPKCSSRGNQYILIGYHHDANHIRAIPIKNRKGQTITEAWEDLHHAFTKAGIAPQTYVLDNERSSDLIDSFNTHNVQYQLMPPYKHCKPAERAVQTHENHFKAALAGADPNYPLAEWDRFIPQANITLNLLRNARVNPKLSAYSYIFGPFNFMATPLAPPGTKVIAHTNPQK